MAAAPIERRVALGARGESENVLFNAQFARFCHPERSEGSAFCGELQIPRCARDDNL
jgi:hypothetical protein